MVSYYREGTELGVNTFVTNDQTAPVMARFANGGFVTLWVTTDTTQDGSGNAIKGQRFDAKFIADDSGTLDHLAHFF